VVPPGGDERPESPLAREPPHLHHPVDRRRRAPEPRNAALVRDRQDVQVDRRREPPIEPHLLAAEPLARRDGGEVEEGKRDSLLELVYVAPGQEYVRDVGLHVLHPDAAMGPQVGEGGHDATLSRGAFARARRGHTGIIA
jgi:hypothetical protein